MQNWNLLSQFLLFSLIFINLYLSAAVYVDAKNLIRPALNISPTFWGLFSFFFPCFGFFIYWIMNHSTLAKK